MADTAATPPRLDGLAFVEGLGPDDLARLGEIGATVAWKEGEAIYRAGQRDPRLYVVEEGRVALDLARLGYGPVTFLTVGPGEILGWSSLFHARPKTSTARALQATRAVAFDADRLRALCDADPRFGYLVTRRILAAVADRLHAARLQLLDVFGRPEPIVRGGP
ncbi:MAG TPA: Crp/Fnr family transcriptional regulator [Isosphaeraceae bacterium]|jgi:CRP-like cAMP-binding protein|nr:Crp/Fnr family transcriptional regulator [Isosphaeraceae bacterium]